MSLRNILLSQMLLILGTLHLTAQSKWFVKDNPIELGQIHWERSLDNAKQLAESKGLPIFLLFQEVPGCSNCTTYGFEVLSHPFIVEVVESHFVPLAIFNNKGGEDREVLKKFKEPSWNNPVVRIINEEEFGLVDRLSGDFSLLGVAERIHSAMIATNQVVPEYFNLWLKELRGAQNQEEAYLSMFCFWTGEREIAKLEGVLSTEAGFMHGKEVVRVVYDNQVTKLGTIVNKAKTKGCADQVYAKSGSKGVVDKKPGRYRVDREVKYYLGHSKYKSLPMTGLQSAKVNAALADKKDPRSFLSPRQIKLLSTLDNSSDFIGKDFHESWYQAIGVKI